MIFKGIELDENKRNKNEIGTEIDNCCSKWLLHTHKNKICNKVEINIDTAINIETCSINIYFDSEQSSLSTEGELFLGSVLATI